MVIVKTLRKKKANKKVLQQKVKEHSKQLHIDWLTKLAEYKGYQLVYLDEAGANRRNGERKYGWVRLGKSAVQTQWLG